MALPGVPLLVIDRAAARDRRQGSFADRLHYRNRFTRPAKFNLSHCDRGLWVCVCTVKSHGTHTLTPSPIKANHTGKGQAFLVAPRGQRHNAGKRELWDFFLLRKNRIKILMRSCRAALSRCFLGFAFPFRRLFSVALTLLFVFGILTLAGGSFA